MQFKQKTGLKLIQNKPFGNCENNYTKLRKEQKMLLTIKEISKILKISESTLYRWVHKREIPFVKLGGKLLFSQDEIQEYIKKNSVSNL